MRSVKFQLILVTTQSLETKKKKQKKNTISQY